MPKAAFITFWLKLYAIKNLCEIEFFALFWGYGGSIFA